LELASRHGAALPKQHNNSGKYLITDGYTSSWKNITWEEVNNKPSVATISYVNQNLALKANISSLSAIATTGNYDDLINKPTIPTNINSLSDVDTSTQAPNLNQVLAWNGSSWIPAYASSSSSVEWDNVLNKPTIAKAALQWTVNHTLADGTRYLAGDLVYDNGNIYKANYDNESIPTTSTLYWQNLGAGYRLNIDGRDIPNIRWNNIGNKPTFASVATSGSYNDLTNKPTLFSGSYNDLTNKPTLFSGSYNDLTNKPSLALVATSGSYNDLTNKPSLALVATSGSYNDLTNKPNALAAGTNSFGYIEHTGIYVVAGKWNSSGNTPSYTNSLYYEGYLNATRFYGAFYGDGSNITNISLYNKTHTGTIYHNGSVRSNLTPVTSTSFSCLTSNYFTKTISSDQTFTFIDVPASGVVYSFILELNYQSGTITWPISVQWSGSVAPTLVSSTINLFVFITRDGGSTWRGSVVKNYGA
jgi:hypothetical protein